MLVTQVTKPSVMYVERGGSRNLWKGRNLQDLREVDSVIAIDTHQN